jgi:tRNA threonylcarbamoyladenosine dehydratase
VGLGGGSNIAELIARKGIGNLVIADPDVYEPHNVRQRGCLASTIGVSKVSVMLNRLYDINPDIFVMPIKDGITPENAWDLVSRCDYLVDMIDLHGIEGKLALHRAAKSQGKYVLTAPSVVNGAVLWVFPPTGPSFEEFFGLSEDLDIHDLAERLIQGAIPSFAPEAPKALYLEAAQGKRTIPLDAVGVDQAAVMCVAALENLILGRMDRVVLVPKGLQVDVSDSAHLAEIVENKCLYPSPVI